MASMAPSCLGFWGRAAQHSRVVLEYAVIARYSMIYSVDGNIFLQTLKVGSGHCQEVGACDIVIGAC